MNSFFKEHSLSILKEKSSSKHKEEMEKGFSRGITGRFSLAKGYRGGNGSLEEKPNLGGFRIKKGDKTIGCRWVFTIKYNSDETLGKV